VPSIITRAWILFEIYSGCPPPPQAQKLKKSPGKIGLNARLYRQLELCHWKAVLLTVTFVNQRRKWRKIDQERSLTFRWPHSPSQLSLFEIWYWFFQEISFLQFIRARQSVEIAVSPIQPREAWRIAFTALCVLLKVNKMQFKVCSIYLFLYRLSLLLLCAWNLKVQMKLNIEQYFVRVSGWNPKVQKSDTLYRGVRISDVVGRVRVNEILLKVWPFKWKLLSSTFLWGFLLRSTRQF